MNHKVFMLVAVVFVSGAASAQAQVIQLPTFQSFSIGTTVSIPDRGAAYLGGVTRGAWGSTSNGVPGLSQVPGLNRLFTNRGIGSSVSSSHAYATATIIDHAEMDRMLLAEAAARRDEPVVASETDRRAAFLSAFVAKRPPLSAAEPAIANREEAGDIAARLAAAESEHEAEMAAYVQRAEAAVAAGRLGAARCCYNALIRRGSDKQQQFAVERMAALETPRAAKKFATRE